MFSHFLQGPVFLHILSVASKFRWGRKLKISLMHGDNLLKHNNFTIHRCKNERCIEVNCIVCRPVGPVINLYSARQTQGTESRWRIILIQVLIEQSFHCRGPNSDWPPTRSNASRLVNIQSLAHFKLISQLSPRLQCIIVYLTPAPALENQPSNHDKRVVYVSWCMTTHEVHPRILIMPQQCTEYAWLGVTNAHIGPRSFQNCNYNHIESIQFKVSEHEHEHKTFNGTCAFSPLQRSLSVSKLLTQSRI